MAWSPPVTTVAPATEPVSLAQAKEYLRITSSSHDTELGSLITVAREQVERMTGTRLVEQTVSLAASCFADLERLPIGPVLEVVSVKYDDTDGVEQTIDAADYELFGAELAQGIRPAIDLAWPVPRAVIGSVRVVVTAGYSAVPSPVWLAMLRMISDAFTFRETASIGAASAKIPMSSQIEDLLANHRIWL